MSSDKIRLSDPGIVHDMLFAQERERAEKAEQQLAERERELSTEKTAHQETQRKLEKAEADRTAAIRMMTAITESNDKLEIEFQETERKLKECQERIERISGLAEVGGIRGAHFTLGEIQRICQEGK